MQVGTSSHPSGAPAPLVSIFDSFDVADHAGRMRGWTMEMDQFSSGQFRGHVVELRLAHMQVIRERTTQTLMKQGAAWRDALVFSFPIEASGAAHLNGHLLASPTPLLCDGADLTGLLTPKYLDVVTIAIPRAWFVDYLCDVGEASLADILAKRDERHLRIHVSEGDVLAMQRGFRQLFNVCEHAAAAHDVSRASASLERQLLQLLTDTLTSGEPIPMNRATPQKRTADRARDYVLANLDEPPSVADLCRHIGISRRSLQGCFQNAFGIAPTQFLRAARLNAVRRELQTVAASGRRVSIGDVAAKWGFWHWSRFAGDYCTLFGELPSQTLQRVARPPS